MSTSKKSLILAKYGLNGSRKKVGVNFWRFLFTGINTINNSEQCFLVELELLNPTENPNDCVLGYTPKVQVSPQDLQYALTGNNDSIDLTGEKILTPTYAVIRICKLGKNSKQLCTYLPVNKLSFSNKPFKVESGNKLFSENRINGFINIDESELQDHPEYFCESGYASWNLNYEVEASKVNGYSQNNEKWIPYGLLAKFDGSVNFDGVEYTVNYQKSCGYVDRFWSKTFPQTWFHISSSNLVSLISGKPLLKSGFAVQGIFNNKLSLICNFEEIELDFCAQKNDAQYTVVWNCSQLSNDQEESDERLHWTVSVTSKDWIIDLDVFCNIKELYNRNLEYPDGKRDLLNVVQSGNATGEIKLYKNTKKSIEQIEYAKIVSAFCEYGLKEAYQS